MVVAPAGLARPGVNMLHWLRKQPQYAMRKVGLWLYNPCLTLMKKIRIYQFDNVVAKANSEEGFWWNDKLMALDTSKENCIGCYIVSRTRCKYDNR